MGDTELQINDSIIVKTRNSDSEDWTIDVEDVQVTKNLAKNIAVVLVLDCSSSLSENFSDVKKYAMEFIENLNLDNLK